MFNESKEEVVHTGLWSDSDVEVQAMVKRVTDFNINNIGNAVKLDIVPFTKGDEEIKQPHYKLKLLYPSQTIKKAFWEKH